ncbi:MAG: aldo/keto reductase [Pseudomonadales bacterium]|nr:aldo/keto reductase [Pseudomonadales bacterium]
MADLRWGILSTGTIAATFANALASARGNRLVAVASRDAAAAQRFTSALPGVRAHAGYPALLADDEVDAVYVATPHPQHARWALAALRAGKAVLCEKPLGLNHAEVMALQDAAQGAGRFLMEAFMYRVHPQTEAWLALARDGTIGEVRHIEASFGYHAPFDAASRLFANDLAGGGIMDVGCYPLSAARLIMGAEPLSVRAHGHLGRTGVDEWSAALLAFEGGVSAQIATGVSVLLDNDLKIFGSRGRIRVPNPWLCADAEGRWSFELTRAGKAPERIEGQARPLYVLEAEHVSARILAGALESPAMSWEDSLGNALALDAWRKSIGLEFERERPATHAGPIAGVPPRPRADAPLQHAQHVRVRGLDKPVSRLVMGCDNQPSMSHAAVMWDHFFELGGNAFDTAYIYGTGSMERLLGHWHHARGIRDDMVIVGKGAHTPHNFPQFIAAQLTESLDRLQTDHVDIYFLHRDNPDVPVGEFVDALNDEVRAGRIRVFGGSNWSLARVRAANEYAARRGLTGMAAVSNNFSLARMVRPIWPGVEAATSDEFRAWLTETGTALLPWSAQARGFFTPWADTILADAARENPVITTMQPTVDELKRTWLSPENIERRARAGKLARERGVEMINVALAWVLRQPFPCLPLIGPRTLAETRSSIRALTLDLTDAELRWLDLET